MKEVRKMVTIPIKGTIVDDDDADVYEFWNYSYTSPNSVAKALDDANGQDIILEINSPGGYVNAGSEIYTKVREYSGNVEAKIVGQACSAASWIALAANKVIISPTAQMMIHRASIAAAGNVDDLSSAINALDEMDRAYVDLYSQRTGKKPEEVYQLMANTTWMNAKTAVENGFADEVMFEQKEPAVVNADGDLPISPEMISKTKNIIHNNKKTKKKSQEVKNLALLLWD